MNKKQILIVFCMFVVFVSAMSIAFAADEIANSTVSVPVDETPIVQSTYAHEDILEADSESFTQLDDKIQNTPVNGSIKLENNYTYSSGERVGTNGIVINKDITIDGDGHTIDGANMASIFQITDNANVVLKNIVFCNAQGTNGSAISLSSNEHVDIINSQFINNSAVNGGAIYIASADTSSLVFSSTIVSSTFKYNRAIDDGGSIYLDSGAHIEGNIFEHETAGIDGGAIYFNGNVDSSSIDSGIIGELGLFNNTLSFCSAGNNGGAVYFDNGGNVTNCNFTGNIVYGDGGAVYFDNGGNVTNCNFTGNIVYGDGGAVYFNDGGNVTNCNFTANTATYGNGGAVYFNSNGSVTNCNFTNNSAGHGGAVYFVSDAEVTNCNFTDNSGDWGGAIYFMNQGTVTNCNFTDNNALHDGGVVYFNSNGSVTNCNFTGNEALDGGAVYFVSDAEVTNCNFTGNEALDGGAVYFNSNGSVTNCNFTGNEALDGGAVYFNSNGSVTNCNFTDNNALHDGGVVYFNSNGSVTNCNFTNNTASNGGAIWFTSNGNVTNCNFANNYADNGGAVYFLDNGAVTDCCFTNNQATGNYGFGGAVYFEKRSSGGAVTNPYNTGSVDIISYCSVTNCTFTENNARFGGAVYFAEDITGRIINCNFTDNKANTGSAIYFYSFYSTDTLNISNSIFLNNRANADALEVTKNDNNITISFTGRNNLLNAIYTGEESEVSFTNVTYWGVKGITNTGSSTIKLSGSNKEAGQNITVGIVVNDELVLNEVKVTDEKGTIVLNINAGDNYYITACHDTDSYYTEAEKTISNMTFTVNVTSQTTTNKTVNITAKSNIYSGVMPGKLLFICPNGDVINATYAAEGIWWAAYTFDEHGDYIVNASYVGLDNVTITNATISISRTNSTVSIADVVLDYGGSTNITVTTEGSIGITAKIGDENATVMGNTIMIPILDVGTYSLTVTTIADADHISITKNALIIVNKCKTELTADAINTTFNANDDLAITLKDGKGALLSNQLLFVDLNGVKMFITDSNGQVMVPTHGLAADTYVARILFLGGDNYKESNAEATVTINKDNSLLSADAITTAYNVNKDLVIVLKDSQGNPIKGVAISVDLNGVKTLTTDAKGQVKISTASLVPKTYAVKITFKGNGNYIGSSKEVKVTVKKATPKIDAKAKTFKKSVKTKKYAVSLKSNVGKAIGNAKVTVKIGKKTYSAKTNAKGQATFKIKKLTKKGKYTAVITYNGDKCYNKVTKKVKIIVK